MLNILHFTLRMTRIPELLCSFLCLRDYTNLRSGI